MHLRRIFDYKYEKGRKGLNQPYEERASGYRYVSSASSVWGKKVAS